MHRTDFIRALETPFSLVSKFSQENVVGDMTICEGLARQTINRFRYECFPSLRAFEKESYYPGATTSAVIDSLSLQQQEVLLSWVGYTQSQLLWIDGCLGRSATNWTTDLAVEIIRIAKDAVTSSGLLDLGVIYQFCSPPGASQKKRSAEIVLQDLIFQLVENHKQNFTREVCRKHSLTKNRFQDDTKSFDRLWTLFGTCLFVARLRLVLIVVDAPDSLYTGINQSSKETEREAFRKLVARMIEVTQQQKITIKVMITTRLPDALDCLAAKNFGPLLQILRSAAVPHRRRPLIKPSRVTRIPIQSEPLRMSKNLADELEETDDEIDTRKPAMAKGTATFAVVNTLGDDEDADLASSDEADYDRELEDSDDEETEIVATSPVEARGMTTWSETDNHEDPSDSLAYENLARQSEDPKLTGYKKSASDGSLDSLDSLDIRLQDSDEEG